MLTFIHRRTSIHSRDTERKRQNEFGKLKKDRRREKD